jgi:hypothetical protein
MHPPNATFDRATALERAALQCYHRRFTFYWGEEFEILLVSTAWRSRRSPAIWRAHPFGNKTQPLTVDQALPAVNLHLPLFADTDFDAGCTYSESNLDEVVPVHASE